MHNSHVTTKRYQGECASNVEVRASGHTISADRWLRLCRERGPTFTADELDRIDELKQSDEPEVLRNRWQQSEDGV